MIFNYEGVFPEVDSEAEKNIDKEITKEVNKLAYYTEQVDELVESADEADMKQVETRSLKIIDKLTDFRNGRA